MAVAKACDSTFAGPTRYRTRIGYHGRVLLRRHCLSRMAGQNRPDDRTENGRLPDDAGRIKVHPNREATFFGRFQTAKHSRKRAV